MLNSRFYTIILYYITNQSIYLERSGFFLQFILLEHFKLYAGSINDPSALAESEEAASTATVIVAGDETTNTIDSKDQLPPGLDVLNSCLNELKLVTRRYSKKQQKWINNRFLASRDRQVPDLYELDTSDVSRWHELVYSPAVTVIDCYRSSQVCEIQPMTKRQHPGAGLNEEVCTRTIYEL